ncbi:MAG TPA: MFS transporter [Alphaproteobacteria bacterium]|jgi:predicted MFS family arabinose efflux permease
MDGGLKALRETYANLNFRLYAFGNLSASVGLWIQRIGIGWLTWELTHSTAWLGGIALAEAIPSLVLALFAGAVVDRIDYFRLMRITQFCSLSYAVVISALAFGDLIGIWTLFFLTMLRGVVIAFNRPSRMTLVYALVGRDMLAPALAVNSIIFNASRFIGPAVGGLIITSGGIAWSFAASAALFLIFTLLLAAMKVTPHMPQGGRASLGSETLAGVRYVWSHQGIRLQLALLIAISLLAKPLTDMLPGFSGKVFDLGAHGLAILLTVHGLGAMLGALWVASRSHGLDGLTVVSISSALAIAVSVMLFIATDIFWIACPLVGLVSFFFIVQSVANQTLIQSAVDPSLRGRVMSLYGMILEGVPSVGALLIGGLAEHWGLRLPLLFGALICLAAWFWAWRNRQAMEMAPLADPR